LTDDQIHRNNISNGEQLNRHNDRLYDFYFFYTAQNILKFSHSTIGTFASHTSQRKTQACKRANSPHPQEPENKGEKSYFNRINIPHYI